MNQKPRNLLRCLTKKKAALFEQPLSLLALQTATAY
jgi:hypothetical protein